MKIMSSVGAFIIIPISVGLGLLGYGIYSLRASRIAKDWPTTEGKIVACEFKESRGDDTTYKVDVEYIYIIDGTSYHGNRIAFGYLGGSASSVHHEIHDRLKSAKTVLVRYDPADATRSVLSYGVNHSTIYVLALGIIFLMVAVGGAVGSLGEDGILSTLVTTR
jgi:hypothetical protein